MEVAECSKYYPFIKEQWPDLTEKQIDKIIKRGLRSLYLYNLYGGDVLLRNNHFTMYFGKLFKNGFIFRKYWALKWKIKLRIQWKKDKRKYDGYYYFGLTEEEFKKYKKQITKTGRRRKKFYFEQLMLYKIPEEAYLFIAYKHYFRIKYPEDCGFTMLKKKFWARDFDYICKRDKDNLIIPVSYEQTSSNKYMRQRFK